MRSKELKTSRLVLLLTLSMILSARLNSTQSVMPDSLVLLVQKCRPYHRVARLDFIGDEGIVSLHFFSALLICMVHSFIQFRYHNLNKIKDQIRECSQPDPKELQKQHAVGGQPSDEAFLTIEVLTSVFASVSVELDAYFRKREEDQRRFSSFSLDLDWTKLTQMREATVGLAKRCVRLYGVV